MTQSLEHPALFDLDEAGHMVTAGAPEASVEIAPDDWADRLTPVDRAFIAVAPDSVSIADRAGHLTHALNEISQANSRRGFVSAATGDKHRPAIEERYGPHTDGMVEGADYNALTGERRARYEFFAASGLGRLALRNRLPVAAEDVDTADPEDLVYMGLNRSWQEFLALYGGTGRKVNTRRNAYKKLLAKQVQYTREGAQS
jgi:hypothetical protein